MKLSNGHHEVESTALPSEALSTPVKAPPSPEKDELSSTAKSSNSNVKGGQFSNAMDKDFTALKDVLEKGFYEDMDSSEDEGMPDYKIGGYHPVHVGEILIDRYIII